MAATRLRRRLGQTGTEYMLVISVITIAVVGAAYAFVEPFSSGVNELGNDVKEILGGQSIGGVGRADGGEAMNTNASSPQVNEEGAAGPGGTENMGAPSMNGGDTPAGDGTRSYDGRSFSNTTDVAYDPNIMNDPLRDILGPGTQNRLNGMPDYPVMTASRTRPSDSQLARSSVPQDRFAVLREDEA